MVVVNDSLLQLSISEEFQIGGLDLPYRIIRSWIKLSFHPNPIYVASRERVFLSSVHTTVPSQWQHSYIYCRCAQSHLYCKLYGFVYVSTETGPFPVKSWC